MWLKIPQKGMAGAPPAGNFGPACSSCQPASFVNAKSAWPKPAAHDPLHQLHGDCWPPAALPAMPAGRACRQGPRWGLRWGTWPLVHSTWQPISPRCSRWVWALTQRHHSQLRRGTMASSSMASSSSSRAACPRSALPRTMLLALSWLQSQVVVSRKASRMQSVPGNKVSSYA